MFLEDNKTLVHDIIEQVQCIIRKYVVSIAFFLMGIKYAFLVGLITGLFNMIPYIGVLTALILSAVITFATAAVTSKVILVIITLVIVHLIDSNVLLPVIVGSSKPFQCLLKSQLNLSCLLCFNRTITTN